MLIPVSDGTIHLDMPFSRLLGKPPVMVAGMTRSTVKAGFVSALLDAGFHIELAGGGHYNATALHAKVSEMHRKIPARSRKWLLAIQFRELSVSRRFRMTC